MPNELYKDEEERDVIQGDEHQAEANGEVETGSPVRENHEGTYYNVKNVWDHY